jgi:hypothetical protein
MNQPIPNRSICRGQGLPLSLSTRHLGRFFIGGNMKNCSISGCNNEYYAKGFCEKHYDKNRKYGDPLAGYERVKNGQEYADKDGYMLKTVRSKRIFVHRIKMEEILGKKLPDSAKTHHIDGNHGNNQNGNLILCDSQAYHMLLHRRERAFKKCGHANWRKCQYCNEYDDPNNLYVAPDGSCARHSECRRKYQRDKWREAHATS